MEEGIYCSKKKLREGGIILYPTDTVWGIGCDATNEEAIERLNGVKKRKKGQPLIVLVNDLLMLMKYVETVPEFVLNFFEKSKYPTTIIYPNPKNLPDNLLAEDGSIGIRIVMHNYLAQLIKVFGKPLVSTSANFSGQPTPASFDEISESLITQVDYVVKRYHGLKNPRTSDIYKITDKGLEKIR